MTQTIAILRSQQAVIDAVTALEREGFRQESMKVLASSNESSFRIETETDTHVDEINDLAQTRRETGGREADVSLPMSYAGAAAGVSYYSMAATPAVNAAAYPAGLLAWRTMDRDDGSEEAFQVLGIEHEQLEACQAAVLDGQFVLAVSTADDAAAERAKEVLKAQGARLL